MPRADISALNSAISNRNFFGAGEIFGGTV
jgi:hypothetical protein